MSFSGFDHQCMSLALQLARRGQYTCDPNPRVGCVIAADRQLIAQGWHQRAGEAHAEVNALQQLDRIPPGATAYVTLEPCSHHGLTPPCADALIQSGISRVVIAASDPDPRVSGKGIQRLEAAGIRTETGLMASESRNLNRGFDKRQATGRPWVRIKSAISLDGRTALANKESQWISCDESRKDVQLWRARSSAILTGSGTMLADDPRLSARTGFEVRQPSRVVLDSRWRTPSTSRLMAGDTEVLVFGSAENTLPDGLATSRAECITVNARDGFLDLDEVLSELGKRQFNEVQVEAGAVLAGAFLQAGLVDEILLYQAPLLLGEGAAGPFALGPLESMAARTHLRVLERIAIGVDTRFLLQPKRD